ncbi:MAG: leukocidin/hemolysin toxin family protein [Deltaproteobacteria bacterium]|nr:leukocidin/hemolysin toxin family protein [Deltaproteobacteria bacterium]
MKRNLVVLGESKSDLASKITDHFQVSEKLEVDEKRRGTRQVDPANVLFVDTPSFGESNVKENSQVRTAMENGVPIVVAGITADLQRDLIGCGAADSEAVLIVKGVGPIYYCKSYSRQDAMASEARSILLDLESKQITRKASGAPAASGALPSLAEAVLEDLRDLKEAEERLQALSDSPFQRDAVPDNRKWTLYYTFPWTSVVKDDPYGEYSGTQDLRYHFSVTFNLLAADDPAKVKVLSVAVSGSGFEPNDTIHYGDHYKGWGQTMTYVQFTPQDNVFSPVEDYVPINQADDITVSAGFSWNVSFTGSTGKGGQGSVSVGYSQDQSHTKSTTSFRTLTETIGNNGMRFYHNANIFGEKDPTEVDMVRIIDALYDSSNEWDSELDKLFKGFETRKFPNLSLSLLKPDSECIWYLDSSEDRISNLEVKGLQAALFNHGNSAIREVQGTRHWNTRLFLIDFSVVDYSQ